MKRHTYKNQYGKRVVVFRKNIPNVTKLGSGQDQNVSSDFKRLLKVMETPPRMGEQRYMAKQRIGRGLRIL